VGDPKNAFDDEWIRYPIYDGASSGFTQLGADSRGNKWFKVFSSSEVGWIYSMLNDGGTLLDLSDDEWVSWSDADAVFFASDFALIDPVDGLWFDGWLFNYGDSITDKGDDEWAHIDSDEPTAMALDTSFGRWFGYAGTLRYLDDGNNLQDPSDDTWVDYTSEDGLPFSGTSSTQIRDIQVDGLNEKWILGSQPSGEPQLCSLNDNGTPKDKSDDTWTYYSTNDGLVGPDISAIAVDSNSDVWIAGSNGLSCLHVNR
jgi:hypothetical protein